MLENTECATEHGQSRETGIIGYTRRRRCNRTWTIQRNWHHRVHKTKKVQPNMNNPEKLAS